MRRLFIFNSLSVNISKETTSGTRELYQFLTSGIKLSFHHETIESFKYCIISEKHDFRERIYTTNNLKVAGQSDQS